MNNINVEIFKDTLKQSAEKFPITPKENAVYYNDTNFPTVDINEGNTPITMVHGGTVSTGYVNADNMRVAILNFADALDAGGLVWVGANTQEENICRCSNLYQILGADESRHEYYSPNARDLNRTGRYTYTDNIIYARDITVFKDDTTYENIEPKQLDVITCPAPSAFLLDYEALPLYVNRLARVVMSAIDNNAECIVLGAWGCGAFNQKPELVAKAFATVLNNYGGHFKKIIFAIRPTSRAEGTDMYKVFKEILTTHYTGEVKDEE